MFRKKIKFVLITFLMLVLFWQAGFLFQQAGKFYSGFAHYSFSYERIRNTYPEYRLAQQMKEFVLPGHCVALPENVTSMQKMMYKYYLYPVEVSGECPYRLTSKENANIDRSNKLVRHLEKPMILVAAVGQQFQDPRLKTKYVSFLQGAVFSLGMFLLNLYVGILILKMIGIQVGKKERTWLFSCAYLLGYLLLTVSVWLYMLAGGQLAKADVGVIWITLVSILFIAGRKVHGRKGLSEQREVLISPAKGKWLTVAAGILLACIVAAVVFIAISSPVKDIDGMKHWILKAKILFEHRQLNFSYSHVNAYPLLWPLNNAIQFCFLGQSADGCVQWSAAIFFLILVIQLLFVLKRLGIPAMARFLAVSFFIVSAFHDPSHDYWVVNFTSANAENIFLAYLTAAIAAVVLWQQGHFEKRHAILSAFLLLAIGLVKLEGLFVVAFFCVGIVFAHWGHLREKKLNQWLGIFALAMVWPILWTLWVKAQGYLPSISHIDFKFEPARLFLITKLMFVTSFNHQYIFITFLLAIVLFLFQTRGAWQPEEKFLGIISFLLILFSAYALMGRTPEGIIDNFIEIYPRLFLHAGPSFVLLWSSRVLSIRGEKE